MKSDAELTTVVQRQSRNQPDRPEHPQNPSNQSALQGLIGRLQMSTKIPHIKLDRSTLAFIREKRGFHVLSHRS